jgi:Spy/CpxP family protein refolding chaperone
MRRIHTAGPFTHLVGAALAAAAFAVAGASAVACNGKNATNGADAAVDAEPVASASSAAEALSAAPDAGGAAPSDAAAAPPVVHHRGLAGAFFRAALDTELTDDQKATIDKLEEPAKNDPGTRHEISAYHADLVASLKMGRFDGAKIQADEATFAKATQARQDEQAAALNGLHEALTADQRKAVVEAIRTSQAAHEHGPAAMSDAGASEWTTRRLERMKSQLVLDLDQQKEVAAVLAKTAPPAGAAQAHFDAMKKQMDTLLAAFEKDAFDAKKLDLSATPGKKPTEALDRQVKYLELLLPILTAGQRDRLAASIDRPREMRDHGRADSIAEPFDMGGGMR